MRVAIRRESALVQLVDVDAGVRAAVDAAQQSIKALYHSSTSSSHKTAIFREVLLACALAPKDALSSFQAADVAEPLSTIMNRKYEIPAFARHLTKLCEAERGPVLERTGIERRQRYRFRNPLFEPFIVMNGLAQGVISDASLAELKSA